MEHAASENTFLIVVGIWFLALSLLTIAFMFFTKSAVEKANKIRLIEQQLCSVKGAAWEANHRINLKTGLCTRCGKRLI